MRLLTFILLLQLFGSNAIAQDRSVTSLGKDDYIIYWSSGGMIWRSHYDIFCITAGGLSVDTTHTTPFNPTSVTALSLAPINTADTLVHEIAGEIPLDLLDKSSYLECDKSAIRMMDCSTTHILARLKGTMYQWQLYCTPNGCSPAIQKFIMDMWKIETRYNAATKK